MRGFCFEIVTKLENAGCLCEGDLYDCFGELGVDRVFDVKGDEEKIEKDYLLDRLKKCGAVVTDPEHYGFCVYAPLKELWFEGKYEVAKKAMAEMSLREFATDNGGKLLNLQLLIEDIYSDTVYDEYGCLRRSMDAWIRDAKEGQTYYIGNVVGMH